MLDPQLNHRPDKISTIHIMGICGTGMAALAGMLQQSGYAITGSDSNVYPPMSTLLQEKGITIMDGYRADNLSHNPDLVIVGNVITKKHEEALALAEKRLPYLSFPQALAEFFIAPKRSIVICGTHGKTTTCSLLATTMYHAGLDPSFMIGGIVGAFASNSRLGDGDFFISEGDEYDTAFFDKGSKFLHYRPEIAIITSIEFDHADIFENLEQIKKSFASFVKTLPRDGLIVANLDDSNVREVTAAAPCQVVAYGFAENSDYRITDISARGLISQLTFTHEGKKQQLDIPLSGRHNCLNALAVTAVCKHIGLPLSQIASCLNRFQGVKRRQEIRGEVGGVTVIDDFAHHPTAVQVTLEGLKASFPQRRLVTVFEPRTNSSRRAIFQQDYVRSFEGADIILLREPVPLANVDPEEMFSSSRLALDLKAAGKEATAFEDTDAILEALENLLKPQDVVAILSNGGFDNIHERLLTALRQKFAVSSLPR